jgi:hypothetical protein
LQDAKGNGKFNGDKGIQGRMTLTTGKLGNLLKSCNKALQPTKSSIILGDELQQLGIRRQVCV